MNRLRVRWISHDVFARVTLSGLAVTPAEMKQHRIMYTTQHSVIGMQRGNSADMPTVLQLFVMVTETITRRSAG